MRRTGLISIVVASSFLIAAAWMPASPRTTGVLPEVDIDTILEMAGVDAPELGTGLLIHIDWPVEAPFELDGVELSSLTVNITETGVAETHQALAASETSGKNASKECSDRAFVRTGPRWPADAFPIVWRFRKSSGPAGIDRSDLIDQLEAAHESWEQPRSTCAKKPEIKFSFRYAGKTAKGIKYDGTNTIDFGSLGGRAIGMNYIWYKDGKFLETDLRLNKADYKWTIRPRAKRKYHVINVVTHELGHQVGLEDLGDPHGRLTMFGRSRRGERSKVTLGRGDLKGVDALSP
ncbi:MAG: matrixin family metalloprotease [Actinomycetota bacterium]